MNEDQSVLRVLPPPAGGWQRLQARRDASHKPGISREPLPWLPLLAGCASTLLLLLLLVPPLKLQLPWTAARLVGEHSDGVPVRPLGEQRLTPLPNDDPRVRIYWMEGAPAGN